MEERQFSLGCVDSREETENSCDVAEEMFTEQEIEAVENITEFNVNLENVEVEINTDSDSERIKLAKIADFVHGLVPEAAAAETVITTSDQQKLTANNNEATRMAAHLSGTSVLTTSGRYDLCCSGKDELAEETSYSIIVSKNEEDNYESDITIVDNVNNRMNKRALKPDDDPQVLLKREKDRLKKHQLRQDAAFRQKEREEAKERMRILRADPEYRQMERDKDRLRRRQARMSKSEPRKRKGYLYQSGVVVGQKVTVEKSSGVGVKMNTTKDGQTKTVVLLQCTQPAKLTMGKLGTERNPILRVYSSAEGW